jgi:hypothetical protein
MSSSGRGRISESSLRKLYEAAVLETDIAKLPDRIEEAKKAIRTRLAELTSSDQSSEWQPLIEAMNVLEDLIRMQARERPPSD